MVQRKRLTSRMIKQERKKMLRQTFLYIFVAIALGLGFLFIVLPGVMTGVVKIWGDTAVFEPEDDIPPQVPIFSAPAEATTESTLAIEGFGEAESQVIFVVNGEQSAEDTLSQEGTFSTEITLTEGENSVSAFSVDAAGNESAVSRVYTIILDTEEPTLEIESPSDGETIKERDKQNLTIKGTTEPEAKVYINGRFTYADEEGAFSSKIFLQDGENKLVIKAEDLAGNSTEKELTVKYEY